MSGKILVVNPNSTQNMTHGLEVMISEFSSLSTPDYFTGPTTSPPSINNASDALASASACLPLILSLDSSPQSPTGYLLACYSDHPLVSQLKHALPHKPIIGIFEASVSTALLLLPPENKFGIVSTGKIWEELLEAAVVKYLGVKAGSTRFAGVETTGLNATDLHDAPAEEVRERMIEATKRLLRKGDVGAVLLGCAGMAGMEEMVRAASVSELGEEQGKLVLVVDGVKSGYAILDGMVKAKLVG